MRWLTAPFTHPVTVLRTPCTGDFTRQNGESGIPVWGHGCVCPRARQAIPFDEGRCTPAGGGGGRWESQRGLSLRPSDQLLGRDLRYAQGGGVQEGAGGPLPRVCRRGVRHAHKTSLIPRDGRQPKTEPHPHTQPHHWGTQRAVFGGDVGRCRDP